MSTLSVGVPRSILHYEFGGFLAWFLERLDVPVTLSPPTDRRIFQAGKHWMLDEVCLPVKAFAGHVSWLVQQDIDAVLIPVIVSHENGRVFPCHVRTRLADIVVALGLCSRERLLTPTFHFDDVGLSDDGLYELGTALGASVEAVARARDECSSFLSPERVSETSPTGSPTIALLGHPYVVEDPWLNGDVIERLRRLGCAVRFAPLGETGYSPSGTGLHFDLAARTMTTVRQWDNDESIDGIVFLLPFNCGPDGDIARHMAQNSRTPMMTLVLDELRSDGGIGTRLEAFVDLLAHRQLAGGVLP